MKTSWKNSSKETNKQKNISKLFIVLKVAKSQKAFSFLYYLKKACPRILGWQSVHFFKVRKWKYLLRFSNLFKQGRLKSERIFRWKKYGLRFWYLRRKINEYNSCKRSIFQTIRKPYCCPDFLFLESRDFKFCLLAYFLISFKCAKFQQDWTTLIKDIL